MSDRDFSRPAEGGSENPGPDESANDPLRGHGSENPGPTVGRATDATEAAADGQSVRAGYDPYPASSGVQSGMTGRPGDPASDAGVPPRENPGPEEANRFGRQQPYQQQTHQQQRSQDFGYRTAPQAPYQQGQPGQYGQPRHQAQPYGAPGGQPGYPQTPGGQDGRPQQGAENNKKVAWSSVIAGVAGTIFAIVVLFGSNRVAIAGIALGVASIVSGFRARKMNPHQNAGVWVTGIVFGFVATIVAIACFLLEVLLIRSR